MLNLLIFLICLFSDISGEQQYFKEQLQHRGLGDAAPGPGARGESARQHGPGRDGRGSLHWPGPRHLLRCHALLS